MSKIGSFRLTMGPTSTLNFAKSRANNYLLDGKTTKPLPNKGAQD